MYAISASHLLKSLKLEVQHCIDLSDPSLCKYMKFAVALVHTSSLPYHFSIVEGGEFPANSRYGSIERSKFCLLGIVGEEKSGGQANGEQEQNNEEQQGHSDGEQGNGEGGGDSGDGESGDEGGKGGEKQKGGQSQEGGGGRGAEKGGEGGDESQQYVESQEEQGKEELGDEKEKQEHKRDEIQKEKGKYDYDYIKLYISVYYIAVPDHSTGIPEATVYAGQVFYKPKSTMRFTAARDLNALRQVII